MVRRQAQRAYDLLPRAAQDLAISAYGGFLKATRYGPAFKRHLAEAIGRTWLTADELEAWQNERLTWYFAELAERNALPAGLSLNAAHSAADLAELPFSTKLDIRAAVERQGGVSRHQARRNTSGTTGAGLVLPTTRDAVAAQWATWWRYRYWHGIRPTDWCAFFGAKRILPVDSTEPRPWRVDRPERRVIYSSQHLSEATVPAMLDDVADRGIRWIHGFPSSLANLAAIAEAADWSGDRLDLRWITTGAERLRPEWSATIERVFGVRPVQHYGMAEAVANISECERGSLHVDEDFSLVEFVDPDDTAADRADDTAADRTEIAGTSFWNPMVPLVRYRTGDLADATPGSCDCGRIGRVVTGLEGRDDDYLALPDGRRAARLDNVFYGQTKVVRAQFRQASDLSIRLLVEPAEGWSDDDAARLAAAARRYVPDVAIEVETHRFAPSGRKHRLVVREAGAVPDGEATA